MASSVFIGIGGPTPSLTSLTLSNTVAQGAAITFSASAASGAYIGPDATSCISFRNGRVGIGTTDPCKGILDVNDGASANPVAAMLPGAVVMVLRGSVAGTLLGVTSSATAHLPGLYLRSVRSRGTPDTPTVVQADDLIGFWESEGYTGSARQSVGNIGLFCEAVSGSILSGYINFLTSPISTGTPVERMRITAIGNVGINATTFGSSAAGVLGIGNGTEPSTSPADMVQLYSVDLSAGNATLGIRTETAVVTESVTSDRTLSVRINGTTYKICLKV